MIEWNQVKDILQLFIIPAYLYHLKEMKDLKKDVSDAIGSLSHELKDVAKEVNELSVTLIGVDGQNGIRSRFRQAERKVDRLALAFARKFGIPHDNDNGDDG